MTTTGRFSTPISEDIWNMKYRLRMADSRDAQGNTIPGDIIDTSVEDTWRRIATHLASVEDEAIRVQMEEQFYGALENFAYLPAGRIMSGAGTARNVTLFNCFVSGAIPDSMDGIFTVLKEAALTMQQGGGIGYDFSTIRPKGTLVKGVDSDASGPLSFMDVYDSMCKTIMSAGARRGAMMATMRCDHPDVEAFITAKREPGRLRNFNLSVLITDPFMDAVRADRDWDLVWEGKVYKTLRARDLWDTIMRSTYDFAEPGVIFIDRINKSNNLSYVESISATNPCLVEGTLVSTPRGLLPVEDIKVGDVISTIDAPGAVETVEKHEDCEVFRVTLSDGSEVLATAAHIFHVARGKKFDTDTRLDQLEIGDKLRLAPSSEINVGPVSPSDELSEREFGLLVGATIGDGCFTEKSKGVKIACSHQETEWTEKLLSIFQKIGYAYTCKSTDSVNTVTSTAFLKLLDKVGMARGKSHEKVLPLHLFNSNPEFLKGYIDGMISTDGNVHMSNSNPMVRIGSASKENLMMVKRALATFGILARVYTEAAKEVNSETHIYGRTVTRRTQAYVLVILGSGLRKLHKKIGLTHPQKSARLKRLTREFSLTGCTWTASIRSIEPAGRARVYDLFEPETDTWIAEGIVHRGCGEQPLPNHGACLLGSINLARLISDPFQDNAHLDEARMERLVATAVRMMDNVVDVSKFPLDAQRKEAQAKRRIGLGVTGLADALIMLRMTYGSDAAVAQTESWMRKIQHAAYRASVDLAKEKGPFPLFDAQRYMESPTIQALDEDLKADIARYGIRNALLTSIAPTGTISLYAGNVSSGIEPVFATAYNRKVLQKDGSRTEQEVVDYAVQLYRETFNVDKDAPLPDYFVTAMTLQPLDHVAMQAAAQKWVDSSISKTINCPEDISFEDFKEVYIQAYETGCKGCTTYRPNDITGSVLSVEAPKADAPAPEVPKAAQQDADTPAPRAAVLDGKTYKVKWPNLPHAFYVTINDTVDQAGMRRPFEVFIVTQNVEAYAWIAALTRMISAVFRRGGDVSFVARELKEVFDPQGGAFYGGRYTPSLVAAIGDVLFKHMVSTGFIPASEAPSTPAVAQQAIVEDMAEAGASPYLKTPCPSCGEYTMRLLSGCPACECGYSKCG